LDSVGGGNGLGLFSRGINSLTIERKEVSQRTFKKLVCKTVYKQEL